MPNPNTPRSTSVTNSKLCLLDIKTLIETSKIEILNTVKNEHAKLNDVIATLLTKIDGLETKNAQLEQRCKRLEQVNTELVNGRDAQITPAEENLAFIYSECEERRLKESNLIFSGIKEEINGSVEERRTRDEEKVNSVLAHLGLDNGNVISTSRIGKVMSEKPRLLRVKMKSVEMKKKALAASKKLRSSEYLQIYVNPDYTKKEQEQQKKLRDSLKKLRSEGRDVMIFRGKIIERSEKEDF
jgi:hypothetical protein